MSSSGERMQPVAEGARAWQVDASVPVSSFMRTDVAYLRENMWVDAAVRFLIERGLREAPVLDADGRPVGVLYVDDVDTEDPLTDSLDDSSLDPLKHPFEPALPVLAGDSSGQQRQAKGQEAGDDGLGFANALLRDYGLRAGFHLDGRRRLRVREVMVPYIPEISAEASIASAALVMYDNQLDHVMVVGDDGRAVGTFSREGLVQWLVDQTSGRASNASIRSGVGRCLRDVMQPAITVRPRASLFTARDLLTTHDREELPVVESGRAVGVVSEKDIYAMMAAHRDDDGWMQELLVEDVMKPATAIFAPGDKLESAVALLSRQPNGPRCLLIEQDGRLLGVVSVRDLTGPAQLVDREAASTGARSGLFPR
jgi:CBS domain-containing protein